MELHSKYYKRHLIVTFISISDGIEKYNDRTTFDYDSLDRPIERCSFSIRHGKEKMTQKLEYKYDGDIKTVDCYDPIRNVLLSKSIYKYFTQNYNGEELRLIKTYEDLSIPEPAYPKITPDIALNPFSLNMPQKDYSQPLELTTMEEYFYDDNGECIEKIVQTKNDFYPNNDDFEYRYNKYLYKNDSDGNDIERRRFFSRDGFVNENVETEDLTVREYDRYGNQVKSLIYEKGELNTEFNYEYEYSDDGIITKKTTYRNGSYSDGKKYSKKKIVTFQYDDRQRIINEIYESDDFGFIQKYFYSY